MNPDFRLGVFTRPLRRADGSVFRCTVPVDFPPAIIVDGDHWHELVGQGYRVADGKPAGLYQSVVDPREHVWFCDGKGYRA